MSVGLFASAGGSRSSQGGDYAKPGQYFIIIENAKFSRHQTKGTEQGIFECRYLHVVEKALWTGDPKLIPMGEKAPLLNLPGTEPKAGEPCSFVFSDVLEGNGARLKAFVLKATDATDEDWDRNVASLVVESQTSGRPLSPAQAAEHLMSLVFDPARQPIRNAVIEIKAGEQTTRKQKKIVASRPLRRVYAEELRQMWEKGQLEPATVDYLSKEERLTRMLEFEVHERASKQVEATKK